MLANSLQQPHADAVTEEWRQAPSYPGLEASSLGRIRVNGRPARILGPYRRLPYLRVAGRHGGEKNVYVHRVVADAHLGPAPDGLQVNHLDGNPLNNAASNLEYVTPGDNIRHAARIGLLRSPRGERQGCAKLTAAKVAEARRAYRDGASTRRLAAKYGVTYSAIWQAVSGATWQHLSEPTVSKVEVRP